jgi:CHAT domain-containing protein
LKGRITLNDGQLELAEIFGIDLPKAKFIFISACQTAMGEEELANETMHLAGGFLAAGFQGAVGKIWNISDRDGPTVANIVYQVILGKDKIPNVKMAAEGLHLAAQNLRKAGIPPSRWTHLCFLEFDDGNEMLVECM